MSDCRGSACGRGHQYGDDNFLFKTTKLERERKHECMRACRVTTQFCTNAANVCRARDCVSVLSSDVRVQVKHKHRSSFADKKLQSRSPAQ